MSGTPARTPRRQLRDVAGEPRPPSPGVDARDDVVLPVTTRIGPRGGPGRAMRLAAGAFVVALAFAVVKPWDWGAAAERPPAAAGGPAAGTSPLPGDERESAAGGESSIGTGPGGRAGRADTGSMLDCLSERYWMTVVDEVADGGRSFVRTWTRVDPAPATAPGDPAIARTHVYADAVLQVGICVPARVARGAPPEARLDVTAWRLAAERGEGSGTLTEIRLRPVAGGRASDLGVLFGVPTSAGDPDGTGTSGGSAGGSAPGSRAGGADPERDWSTGGGRPWRPAAWSTGPGEPAVAWPPGTYVFRVAPVTRLGDPAPTWVAVEVRGPWIGPGEPATEGGGPGGGPGAAGGGAAP